MRVKCNSHGLKGEARRDYDFICQPNRPASSVAEHTLLGPEVMALITGPVKLAQCRQRLATATTFLVKCGAQALSCGNELRQSLHALA